MIEINTTENCYSFKGNSFDLMIDSLCRAFGEFEADVFESKKSFEWSLDLIYGKNSTIITGAHSRDFNFKVAATENTGRYLSLCLPISGGMGVTSGSRTYQAEGAEMLFYSNLAPETVSMLGDNNKISEILLPFDRFKEKILHLGYRECDAEQNFINVLHKRTRGFYLIRNLANLLIDGTSNNGPLLKCDLAFSSMIECISDLLIFEITENSTSNHQIYGSAASPLYVRKAVEYIHSNIRNPISISDIAAELRISTRSLELGFRNAFQLSPAAYVHKVRMDAARFDLLNSESKEPIKAICLKWGFYNFGRFAALYRKEYGETPSETIKRVRT